MSAYLSRPADFDDVVEIDDAKSNVLDLTGSGDEVRVVLS